MIFRKNFNDGKSMRKISRSIKEYRGMNDLSYSLTFVKQLIKNIILKTNNLIEFG
jgi:hypothetical protein